MDWSIWVSYGILGGGLTTYIGMIAFVELRRRSWRRDVRKRDAQFSEAIRVWNEDSDRAQHAIAEQLALLAVVQSLGPGDYRITIREGAAPSVTRH